MDESAEELFAELASRHAPEDLVPVEASIYTDFPEFSRKQIKNYETLFEKYDTSHDRFLSDDEMRIMMEKLEAPQTYLGIKEMIKEVDADGDGALSFRDFLGIFRKAQAGELQSAGLQAFSRLSEIDVDETGVLGAKSFFEQKMNEASSSSKFEEEIRKEQEERKREEEERRARKERFRQQAQHDFD